MLATATAGGASTLRETLNSWVERHFQACAAALVALVVLLGWAPRLFRSLWLDETGTYWQAHRGWLHAIRTHEIAQSILHTVITSLFYFGPGQYMEFWMRLPSVLAMLVAAYFVFRLAVEWFGADAGWLALVLFVSERQIVLHATEARPYPLALAVCLGLLYGLHSWLAHGRRSGWFLFTLGIILIPYTHYLFLAFLLVPALYVVVRMIRGQRLPWLALLGSSAIGVLSWIPLLAHFTDVVARGSTLSFLPIPPPGGFIAAVLPIEAVFAAFLGVACGLLLLDSKFKTPDIEAIWMARICCFWALAGPAVLFVVSHVRGYGVLVERYCLYSAAGLVLLATYFFMLFNSATARLLVMLAFAGLATLHTVTHFREDDGWRPALTEMKRVDPAGAVPTFVVSGFVESNSLDWEHSLGDGSYLYAALTAYPVSRTVYPLPLHVDDRAKAFATAILDGDLRGRERVFLVTDRITGETVSDMTDWIVYTFSARGYTLHRAQFPSSLLLEFDAPQVQR